MIKIIYEINLVEFDFYDEDAAIFIDKLTKDEINKLEAILEDVYKDGISLSRLNDLFGKYQELLYELLSMSAYRDEYIIRP